MNSPETKQPIALTYEERQALPVIRKLLKRRPEAAAMVFEGMAKESAVSILLQAKKELADLLAVSHAITQASGEIAKLDKEKEPERVEVRVPPPII